MSYQLRAELVSEPDEALMAAFYGCSELAFEVLTERWWPRLFGFFRRKRMCVEDAEDLVIQTLVKLYLTKERQSYDLEKPLSPFLFTVATRVYIGWIRKQQGSPQGVQLIEALDLASEPQQGSSATALATAIVECLERFPEVERDYILNCGKHGLGDLSHNDIAAILDKWPAQVTQISKSARARLKRCLQAKGYGKE